MSREERTIATYEYWTLYLNEFQCYLGRTYLVANRADALDFIAMTRAERDEFFEVGARLNAALKRLFQPDLMNYASLGNVYRHLHVHFIPRYQSSRLFHNILFEDKRWGKNYEPYDREFLLPPANLEAIRKAIHDTLLEV